MAVIDLLLAGFVQTNTIVKGGQALLMSGEFELGQFEDASASITCYIGKKKKTFSQEREGNVNAFQAYVCAKTDVSPAIETNDLIIDQRGSQWVVGATSIRNDNTDISGDTNAGEYLYAELELFEEDD